MITVACVYWQGQFRGREDIYSVEWVEKMKNMVARNLPREHRFVCLSNVKIPCCERIPLQNDWPGWWSKIELFRPGLFDGDRVLYIDLDTIIVNDLTPFIDFPSKFAIMSQPTGHMRFNTKRVHPSEGKFTVYHYQSSVMVFDGNTATELYTDFDNFKMQVFRGDQDYISAKCSAISVFGGDQDYIGGMLPELDTFPEHWIKKLRNLPGGVPTNELKIILCMLGKRLPRKNIDAARKYDWIKEVWK